MQILKQFIQVAPVRVTLSIILGALAGIAYSALIPLVMVGISPEDPAFPEVQEASATFIGFEVSNYPLASLFFFTCIFILFTRTVSETMLMHVGAEVAKNIRLRFYERVRHAALATIEQVGFSKLITAINIDVPRLVMGARMLPQIFINLVTLLGMLSFLLYLNPKVFNLVIASIVVGAILYQLPMSAGRRVFTRNRETHDALQAGIKGLIYGVKELKLDEKKTEHFHKESLLAHENTLLGAEKLGQTIMRATISLGDLISFIVIGSIAFIFLNYYTITQQELVGVIMALLYITAPISIILNAIPTLTISGVSNRKIRKVLASIPEEGFNGEIQNISQWKSLHFRDVEYQYPDVNDEKGFHIGPLNFSISRGKVTFIVGGNGSGKSTLSKLITQHYKPNSGCISYDDEQIDGQNISSFRQEIYAIYSNYYLFDELLGEVSPSSSILAQKYLCELDLDRKVTIKDGRFSTTSLSDGQRKRLALLVAFLADKSVYLFDEWAADQDPEFKDVFYHQILPDLKAKNKAVVVISHDEKYFCVADELLQMDQGKLIKHSPLTMPTQHTLDKSDEYILASNVEAHGAINNA